MTLRSILGFVNQLVTASATIIMKVSSTVTALTISSTSVLIPAGSSLVTGATTVSGLPGASVGAGARAFVTDASVAYAAANLATVVVGGGANKVPVYSDGTNWLIG